MKLLTEIDHIDPKWEEGRDYQLVCGMNTSENYCERDALLNAKKNNRFLPWRVSVDELGTVPIEPGDLCQFLDLDTGEWVLEEFMGEWWFEKTKKNFSSSIVGQKNVTSGHLKSIEGLGGTASKIQGVGIFGRTAEQHALDSRKGGKKGGKIGGVKGGKKSRTTKENYAKNGRKGGPIAMAQKYVDPDHLELGAHSAATLSRMQRARNFPHQKENRVKL